MGTIDFARGRDNPAMVPAFALCLLLPALVSAAGHEGGHGDMGDQMMQMMQMMNMMKGWGGDYQEKKEPAKEWYKAQNSEDYEAYLKWCEENKARQADQKRQQELLDMFKAREAARKEEMEKDRLEEEIAEEKMSYYKMVLNEFLKFCKCNNYNDQIKSFFSKEGSMAKGDYEEWDITDLGLTAAQSTDPLAVARAVLPLSDQERVKNYFHGLAMAMCEGARGYYDQIHQWEDQYKFIERLS